MLYENIIYRIACDDKALHIRDQHQGSWFLHRKEKVPQSASSAVFE